MNSNNLPDFHTNLSSSDSDLFGWPGEEMAAPTGGLKASEDKGGTSALTNNNSFNKLLRLRNCSLFYYLYANNIMRKIAFIILLIGSAGSFGLVLNAGRHSPILLLILFIGWVLSPYIALFLVHVVSKLQLIIAPKLLYYLMLFVSLGSLACYVITLIQHSTKTPTGVYLSVPFLSWFLIVIAIVITAYRKRKPLKK